MIALFVRLLVAQQNGKHLHGMGRMDGFKNNPIATGDFSVEAFMDFTFQRLYKSTKGVIGKFPNIVQDTIPPIGRYRFKLFCGAGVDVYEPGHALVGPG
jgi:hypothetical protein